MKKTTLVLAVLIASLASTRAQISVSIPAGVSTLRAFTAGVNIQAAIRGLRLAAGFDNHFSRDINKGNLVWARMGAGFFVSELNSIEATAGFGQINRSSDQKNLNQGLGVVNVQYVHNMKFHPEASSFIGITGTKEFAILTGGLRLTFLKKERAGCPASRIR